MRCISVSMQLHPSLIVQCPAGSVTGVFGFIITSFRGWFGGCLFRRICHKHFLRGCWDQLVVNLCYHPQSVWQTGIILRYTRDVFKGHAHEK